MDHADLRSPLLRTLAQRGFIHQATDLEGLDALALAGPISAYIGFDLTAPSLHVGSMIQMMVLRHLKAHGHKPVVLFGDATTRIGDPSDKNGARPVLTTKTIETNYVGIVEVIDRIVGECSHVHNSDWLDGLSFMDFLTGTASQMSLNRMVATDIVSRRLDANLPMTLMELCYSALQGMDFAELSTRRDVSLQIGGSDQWTNILTGLDLARRRNAGALFGLTTPLMTDEAGRKMGKTAEGQAVWLSPDALPTFDLWQFWRNVPDGKVREFLALFTDLPMDEVRRLGALGGAEINEAKTVLATEATAIAHGRDAAVKAAAAAGQVFSGTGHADDMPTFEASVADLATWRISDLAVRSGLADSKAAARRLAAQGGLRIDGVAVTDADQPVPSADADLVLSAGRKRHVRIVRTR